MKKNKKKGPARFPPANAVFEARRAAVQLTLERDKAIQALRHSNAAAAYMLSLIGGKVEIPAAEYKALVADDDTVIGCVYEGELAVVRLSGVKPEPTAALDGRLLTTHSTPAVDPTGLSTGAPIGNVTIRSRAATKDSEP